MHTDQHLSPLRLVQKVALCIMFFIGISACSKNVNPTTINPTSNSEEISQAKRASIELIDAYIPYRSDDQQHFAAYFTLQNNTSNDLTIVAAHSPAFGLVMLHETIFEEGMAKMKHIESLKVNASTSVEFKPKGKHIMLMQAKRNFSNMSGIYLVLETSEGQKLKFAIDFDKQQRKN